MELEYPINLIGIENGAQSGDVLCRYGEVLGRWELETTGEHDGIAMGELHFTPHGGTERLFSEGIPSMESGLLFGKAMSFLCASIREWHEQSDT